MKGGGFHHLKQMKDLGNLSLRSTKGAKRAKKRPILRFDRQGNVLV